MATSPSLRTHADVSYRRPAGLEGRRCQNCVMFRATHPPSCTAVMKPIYPLGVCKIWAARKESSNAVVKS